MNLIKTILAAILRRPATTDAITSALTKTVSKLEAHSEATGTKAASALDQAAALVATATAMQEDAKKAAAVAKNLGALFK